tara:strand:- start:17 stop:289 length:273 start_codon:yes stop_codon:yes gene_type:complete
LLLNCAKSTTTDERSNFFFPIVGEDSQVNIHEVAISYLPKNSILEQKEQENIPTFLPHRIAYSSRRRTPITIPYLLTRAHGGMSASQDDG